MCGWHIGEHWQYHYHSSRSSAHCIFASASLMSRVMSSTSFNFLQLSEITTATDWYQYLWKFAKLPVWWTKTWRPWVGLNHQPFGKQPNALTDCATETTYSLACFLLKKDKKFSFSFHDFVLSVHLINSGANELAPVHTEIPGGLVVRISRSHRVGRGSIPRLGMFSHFFSIT